MAKKRKKKRPGGRSPSRRSKTPAKTNAPTSTGSRRLLLFAFGTVMLAGLAYLFLDFAPGAQSPSAPPRARQGPAPVAIQEKPPWDLPAPTGRARAVPSPTFDDFVGAERCADCHASQFQRWRRSTHGRAGSKPSREFVLSAFDGTVLEFSNAIVRMQVSDAGEFFYHVDKPGMDRETFQVSAFVGRGHMVGGGTQASFTTHPDGSVHLLPFDYASGQEKWFCDTSGSGWLPITGDFPIEFCRHWPPSDVFASNCGNCHSSQLNARFDVESQRMDVRFKDLAINCESCHGPGRLHVELAESPGFSQRVDVGMEPLDLLEPDESLNVCFRCHAMTQQLASGFLPGRRFEDYYSINFYDREVFHPDGRTLDFGYQNGHQYSDCYLNGSMTCVDCHDPHSQQYRDVERVPLEGRLDDGQCTGCHGSKAEDVQRHTHHPPDSKGSACVSCHMPYLQQPVVGDQIRYARSDHTIAIPRPDHDASISVEGACAQCHSEMPQTERQAKVDEWWGETKPQPELFAGMLDVRLKGDGQKLLELFSSDLAPHVLADFDLLRRMPAVTSPGLSRLGSEEIERLKRVARKGTVDQRGIALALLHIESERSGRYREFIVDQLRNLGDDETAIRRRWGLFLSMPALELMNHGASDRALVFLRMANAVDPEQWRVSLALVNALESSGQVGAALEQLEKALSLEFEATWQYDQAAASACRLIAKADAGEAVSHRKVESLCESEKRDPSTL